MAEVKALFPAGVEVRSTDLQLESDERQRVDRTTLRDITLSGGVAEGLVVSSNGATLSVTAGRGYTPGGYEVSLSATVPNISPIEGDSVLALRYSEAQTDLGEDLGGASVARRVSASSTLVTYTQAEFDALPSQALDFLCPLALVSVTSGSLTSLTRAGFRESLQVEGQAVEGLQFLGFRPAVPGTSLAGLTFSIWWTGWRDTIDPTGLLTNGVLTAGDATPPTAGANISRTTGGNTLTFALADLSGNQIDVRVRKDLLPTDPVEGREFTLVRTDGSTLTLTAVDIEHRLQRGTFPNPTNPHGTSGEESMFETGSLLAGARSAGYFPGVKPRIQYGRTDLDRYTLLEEIRGNVSYPAYRRYYRISGDPTAVTNAFSVSIFETFNAKYVVRPDGSGGTVEEWEADNIQFDSYATQRFLAVSTAAGVTNDGSGSNLTFAVGGTTVDMIPGEPVRSWYRARESNVSWTDRFATADGWQPVEASPPATTPSTPPSSGGEPVVVQSLVIFGEYAGDAHSSNFLNAFSGAGLTYDYTWEVGSTVVASGTAAGSVPGYTSSPSDALEVLTLTVTANGSTTTQTLTAGILLRNRPVGASGGFGGNPGDFEERVQ